MDIYSNSLEKCINIELHNHFRKFLTKNQHSVASRRSVQTNRLLFLRRIYKALDYYPHSEITAFYTDPSKTFDNIPRCELIQKMIDLSRYNKQGTPGATPKPIILP